MNFFLARARIFLFESFAVHEFFPLPITFLMVDPFNIRCFHATWWLFQIFRKNVLLPRLPLQCVLTLIEAYLCSSVRDNYVLRPSFKRKKLCHASRHAVQNQLQIGTNCANFESFQILKTLKDVFTWYDSICIAYGKNYALFWTLMFRPPSLCPSPGTSQEHKRGRPYIYIKNIDFSFAYNFWSIISFELKLCQNIVLYCLVETI